jgi:Septum formation inhibitor-activating ATPase
MGIAAVITSGKGGVGKSTVTVGLGRALARRGHRVLMLDCDAGLRSLDHMTGVGKELVYDVADVVHARCAPIDAIYPCKDAEESLFLMPAPAFIDNRIYPEVMGRFVPFLKEYYDYVLIDSPAGVGVGFQAATCAADRALIVCSPDPICIKSASAVRDALQKTDVAEQHLIINRLNEDSFYTSEAYEDLDAVIDGAGVQLIGVVHEDFSMVKAFFKGTSPPPESKGMMAMERIAGRFEGEMVPFTV